MLTVAREHSVNIGQNVFVAAAAWPRNVMVTGSLASMLVSGMNHTAPRWYIVASEFGYGGLVVLPVFQAPVPSNMSLAVFIQSV
jgi:hypothetical protein